MPQKKGQKNGPKKVAKKKVLKKEPTNVPKKGPKTSAKKRAKKMAQKRPVVVRYQKFFSTKCRERFEKGKPSGERKTTVSKNKDA